MAWSSRRKAAWYEDRISLLGAFFGLFTIAILLRMFFLQVVEHNVYAIAAQDQQQLIQQLMPVRGDILVRDAESATGTYPLATKQTLHLLYAVPTQITKPDEVTHTLSSFVTTPEADILQRVSKKNDVYEPIAHNLTDEQETKIAALKIPGIGFMDEVTRYYPEQNIAAQLLGFVGYKGDVRVGRYGVEQTFESELAGKRGYLNAQKDATGQLIATAAQVWQPAINGSNIVLTIDRALEYYTCTQLDAAVKKHGADNGSAVIMDPQTGAILALCTSPDFDLNAYSQVTDAAQFLDLATQVPYEPGSVFKAITMSAALNEGKVTPESTYTDTGEEKIGSFTIQNSDKKANGVQTMTQVLEKSLNTGAIYAMRQIGPATFAKYVKAFGFGSPTGVEIPENAGNVSSLDGGKEIYAATGAFGQGITVTPLQLAAAYGAMANGGKLMQPYVVDRIVHADGTQVVTQPKTIRQVITPQTSATIAAMLVNVVRNGHGKRAGVPGYFVAGKTGTAQIPDPEHGGYLTNLTFGTFAGFAPVEDPKFVMVVQLNKPRDVQFAESSAAPLFGDIAKFFLLNRGIAPTDKQTSQ